VPTSCQQQALIDAPVGAVWELVGDPRRYDEWWPRVVEVRGERFDQGDDFAQVTRVPLFGSSETTFVVDAREELHELQIHCTVSGSYFNWVLAEARGGTFVDVEFGIRPATRWARVFDQTLARRYLRRWLDESVRALTRAAGRADPA
jgi:hypothetical protein